MNRQKVALAILVVVLIVAAAFSYTRMPRQKTVDKLTYVKGMVAKTKKDTKAVQPENTRVLLELFDAKGVGFTGARRNIFKPLFSEHVKLPPLPPPPPPPAETLAVPPPPPPAPPAPPVAQGPTPVQRDMARFTFLGFLKKDNQKTIFLSSDKEIFLVKKGDKIAGKYEVANLTEEALTISILPDGGEIIIPLVENRSLSAPRR